jgi:hypothetical protein
MKWSRKKSVNPKQLHTEECLSIHYSTLMSMYSAYGAVHSPLVVPVGGMNCTCPVSSADDCVEVPAAEQEPEPAKVLVTTV